MLSWHPTWEPWFVKEIGVVVNAEVEERNEKFLQLEYNLGSPLLFLRLCILGMNIRQGVRVQLKFHMVQSIPNASGPFSLSIESFTGCFLKCTLHSLNFYWCYTSVMTSSYGIPTFEVYQSYMAPLSVDYFPTKLTNPLGALATSMSSDD